MLSCMMCVGVLLSEPLSIRAEDAVSAMICNHNYSLYMDEVYVKQDFNDSHHWDVYQRVGRCGHCHAVVEILGTSINGKALHDHLDPGGACSVCKYSG